jgi:putative DNA-invertase from lambdoid prophage Rac
MSRVFAYCRVSTNEQATDNQVLEIAAAGFKVTASRTITETVSGSVAASERKGWRKLLEKLSDRDEEESPYTLVVTKLDRLGRNAMDVRATVQALAEMEVKVYCLALGGMDLTSAVGNVTMQIINAMAEFERDLLIERTHAGLSRAKAEGKTLGRKPSLSAGEVQAVQKRLSVGDAVAAIARDLGTSRQTIMRVRDAAAA